MKPVFKTLTKMIPHAFLSLAVVLLTSCGAPETSPTKKAPVRPHNGNALPTLANFNDWKTLWDGKSWIIAWKDSVGKSPTTSAIRSHIVHGILPGTLFSDNAAVALAAATHVELLTTKHASKKENISGFSVVKFSTLSPAWSQFLPAIPWHENAFGIPSLPVTKFLWSNLEKIPDAAWVEPDLQSELLDATTDTTYALPPQLSSGGVQIKRIRADVAWRDALNADGTHRYEYGKTANLNWTNVAVVDTGVDYTHPSLYDSNYDLSHIFTNPREKSNCQDNDGNGYIGDIHGIDATIEMSDWNAAMQKVCNSAADAQPIPGPADLGGAGKACPDGATHCGHGTHVSGIIAAKPGGTGAAIGVCPSCRIVSIRVASTAPDGSDDGSIDDSAQIRAVNYILGLKNENGDPYVRIVNMSLGKYFISRSLEYWFRKLLENDILVIAAAGNDDTDTINYPAGYAPVLSVCATSEPSSGGGGRGEFAKTSFSNFGSWVDICAPGFNITSTFPGGGEHQESGTSQATPFVAGAAGYLKSLDPTMSGADIAKRLTKYANAVNLYHGKDTTNDMNRLYEGWFPDGTQYYLLGTGFLDLGSAVTEGKSCWNTAAKPDECVSYVFSNNNLGYLSQLPGGCVISSLSSNAHPVANAMASMPFLMLQVGALFSLARRLRKRNQKNSNAMLEK